MAAAEGSAVAVAVVAAIGAFGGAALTVIGSIYASRRKEAELRIEYAQRLQDRYLENARGHLEQVYLPLHAAVSSLVAGLRQVRLDTDPQTGELHGSAKLALRGACEAFLQKTSDLLDGAAGAFLTSELEDRLEDFRQFLFDSLDAVDEQRRVAVAVSFLGLSTATSFTTGRKSTWMRSNVALPGLLGLQVALREERVVSAPLGSPTFTERFAADTASLRALIKEVTLGTR